MYAALIGLHAAAGLVAVAAGVRLLGTGSGFGLYFGSLVACIAFVAGAVALDWGGLDAGTRVLFAGLLALGCYMIFRGARAGRRVATETGTRSIPYVDDVGFTIVALLDAFWAGPDQPVAGMAGLRPRRAEHSTSPGLQKTSTRTNRESACIQGLAVPCAAITTPKTSPSTRIGHPIAEKVPSSRWHWVRPLRSPASRRPRAHTRVRRRRR
jgi:hypothetical protein